LNIFEYLCIEARKLTRKSLIGIKSKSDWENIRTKKHSQFVDMLGISEYMNLKEKPPLNVKITGTIERDEYIVNKLYYESLPKLYVTGNLYIPKNIKGRVPGILYLSGHAANQKFHYQAHPRKFAQLGFVALIIETIQLGEIPGYHHGVYKYGMFNWYSLGYTPAGVEVWNAIRAIDLLQSRPEVDPERIGVTGISGGGAITWYTAAIDERIKVAAPVCGTATISSHVCKRTIDSHCDCMFWINNYMWDLTDIGALIAPRPLLIASAKKDWIFDIKSVREIYRKLKDFYTLLGFPENIMLVETPGPHSYHETSRKAVFAWFLKHLKKVNITLHEVEDIDKDLESLETAESLKVFTRGIPSDERVTTVQDWFIKPVPPPKIRSIDDLLEYKDDLKTILLEKTFNAFPKEPEDLDIRIELEQEDNSNIGYLVSFVTEKGWRLHMHVIRPKKADIPSPIMLILLSRGQTVRDGIRLFKNLDPSWARAYVELRGVGINSWGKNIQWYLRRAAMLTGRTIASIRVYDSLRALEALSRISWVDKNRIALFGSGEMAVVALYAAFLRGNLASVLLHEPPSSQNIYSNPDGTDNVIEMLNCLRYTDLPYIAGLLWPTQLVFLGVRPTSYVWAEDLYRRLGSPGMVRHIKDISQWSLG